MAGEFVHPNWHVIFIHYPLGLLGTGLVIELLSFLWGNGGFRAAGRWMILLGGLLTIPAALLGAYAFRDVVAPNVTAAEGTWHEAVAASTWNEQQWHLMRNHVWLAVAGTIVTVLLLVLYLAFTPQRRQSLHWPLLLAAVLGAGLLGAASWYSGEAVYRHGTAVSESGAPAQVQETRGDEAAEEEEPRGAIAYFLPPLQVHLLMAGIGAAFGLGALGLTIRKTRYTQTMVLQETGAPPTAIQTSPTPGTGEIPLSDTPAETGPAPVFNPTPVFIPARFWLVCAGFLLLAAIAGVWTVGGLTPQGIREAMEEIGEPGHTRLLLHAIFGVALLVLPLIIAPLVRWWAKAKMTVDVLWALWVVALAVQVWLGVLILYDDEGGPLTGFTKAPQTTTAPAQPPTTAP